MKKLMPVLIALLGLGVGVGAGLMLKPAPEAEAAAACAPSAGHGHEGEAAPCPSEPADPLAPAAHGEAKKATELAYVPIDKSFVVPIFAGEKVKAMVVLSLSVATDIEAAPTIEAVKPRLRDSFLKALFLHANSGGFDGPFTSGRNMDDLKSALLVAAREVLGDLPVEEVLITEIARQDS